MVEKFGKVSFIGYGCVIRNTPRVICYLVCPHGMTDMVGKIGFRYDKNLGMDLDLTVAGAYSTRRFEHVLDLELDFLSHDPNSTSPLPNSLIPLSGFTYQSVSAGEFPLHSDFGCNWFGLPAVPIGDSTQLGQMPWYSSTIGVPLIVNYEELASGCRTFENSFFWGYW